MFLCFLFIQRCYKLLDYFIASKHCLLLLSCCWTICWQYTCYHWLHWWYSLINLKRLHFGRRCPHWRTVSQKYHILGIFLICFFLRNICKPSGRARLWKYESFDRGMPSKVIKQSESVLNSSWHRIKQGRITLLNWIHPCCSTEFILAAVTNIFNQTITSYDFTKKKSKPRQIVSSSRKENMLKNKPLIVAFNEEYYQTTSTNVVNIEK